MTKERDQYATRLSLLIKLRNQHDDASWADFVSTYERYILKIIASFQIPEEDIQDLKQSVLVKLWKRLPEFSYDPGKGQFRYWLGGFTRNCTLEFLRQRKRTIPGPQSRSDQPEFEGDEAEIESIISREWEAFVAEKAWEKVAASTHQNALNVYVAFADGMTGPQVAESLGIELGTVYVYKQRVQKALRKEILRLEYELN